MNYFSRKDKRMNEKTDPQIPFAPRATSTYDEMRDPSRPVIRRDPDAEAVLFSATAMLELKRRNAELETALRECEAECATWRASAEVKQDLIDSLHRELNKYKGYALTISADLNTAGDILVRVLERAKQSGTLYTDRDGTPSLPPIDLDLYKASEEPKAKESEA